MREQLFRANSISTTRKKKQTTIENSFGAIDIAKKDEKISIDIRRKGEYFEPIHENSREKLEDGHVTSDKTKSGEVTVDSKNKESSAVNYQENEINSNVKITRNLYRLKEQIFNETLLELLGENKTISNKIEREIEHIKKQSDEIILSNLSEIEQKISDEQPNDDENEEDFIENSDM